MTLLNTQETAVVRRPDEALRPGRAGGGARPAAGGPARRAGRAVPGWAALAVCCLAQFMVVLDRSSRPVNVASLQVRVSADMRQPPSAGGLPKGVALLAAPTGQHAVQP
jgi:hypothetical protein